MSESELAAKTLLRRAQHIRITRHWRIQCEHYVLIRTFQPFDSEIRCYQIVSTNFERPRFRLNVIVSTFGDWYGYPQMTLLQRVRC